MVYNAHSNIQQCHPCRPAQAMIITRKLKQPPYKYYREPKRPKHLTYRKKYWINKKEEVLLRHCYFYISTMIVVMCLLLTSKIYQRIHLTTKVIKH